MHSPLSPLGDTNQTHPPSADLYICFACKLLRPGGLVGWRGVRRFIKLMVSKNKKTGRGDKYSIRI